MIIRSFLLSIAAITGSLAIVSPDCGYADELPPPVQREVDFRKDIVPVISGSCVKCHTGAKPQGGFRLDTREQLLAGGDLGPAVEVGKSDESYLIELVAAVDPSNVMPAQGPRLTAEQVGLLRAWIDQGLPWEEGFEFEAVRIAELAPRRPELPAASSDASVTNPIDRLLQPYYEQHGIQPGEVVSDRVFARRVYLDLLGLLPPPESIQAFVDDNAPGKRAVLVRQLLDDRRAYAEHWLTFWNDALRNAYRGTGFIDGGRKQITDWLYQSLYDNKPYDQFVHELISPVPGSEGFIDGIIWRGVVNASQRREMQAAQNVSQVIMGTNLKCASCHDSFVNHWKLDDAYSLAAVFAEGDLEMHRCDKPTGEIARAGFIYPELGTVDADAPRAERMEQLADIITQPENGRLARTLVNRLWAWTFGRGIVEPVDDMDQAPWNEELLDWLAADFQDNGYDIKRTLELICTSRAYQLPSVGAPRPDETEFTFTGPLVKRMTAEQFVDAVGTLTGSWPDAPAISLPLPATATALRGEPIHGKEAHDFVKFDSGVVREGVQEVDVQVQDARVLRLVVSDGGDGSNYDWADWGEPRLEGPAGTKKLTELKWRSATTGYGEVQFDKNVVKKPLRLDGKRVEYGIGTHAPSVIEFLIPEGYDRFRARVGPDTGSVEQENSKVSVRFFVILDDEAQATGIRAALVNDNALTRALGRPNREQVVTRRDTIATTLQAIELTNGESLDKMLAEGAERWLRSEAATSQQRIEAIYETALGRRPLDAEQQAAQELLASSKAPRQALQDLLWIITMLPEFQLVY